MAENIEGESAGLAENRSDNYSITSNMTTLDVYSAEIGAYSLLIYIASMCYSVSGGKARWRSLAQLAFLLAS